MIFTPPNDQLVMTGQKTQTRRPVKEGDYLTVSAVYSLDRSENKHGVSCCGMCWKWREGHTYAVQPGRGKPAIGRIRIMQIRRERLQNISEEDAIAEGARMPYTTYLRGGYKATNAREAYAAIWDALYRKCPGLRWWDNPEVWCLAFEVVS